MIINNARGSHSSPGVYTKEVDVQYSVKSLGITSLGVAGETVKGPAFEPIKIEKWSEFVDYFGSTSTEKYKSGTLKYELPYIAKEYLKESKQLHVCRVLGLSGYDAGPAYVIKAQVSGSTSDVYPVAILRQKAEHTDGFGGACNQSGDTIDWKDYVVTIEPYTPSAFQTTCTTSGITVVTASSSTDYTVLTKDNLGKFNVKVEISGKTDSTKVYPVSLNANDKDYIYNVFGGSPLANDTPLFVEELYDYALLKQVNEGKTMSIVTGTVVTEKTDFADYNDIFKCACTPWLVSQVETAKGTGNNIEGNVRRLFRLYTISDGNNANYEVKVSIEKIKPEEGVFDLIVRAMGDTDASPVVLESFKNCNLVEGDKNYLPLRVGSYDGTYELKSKYIAVEMNEETDTLGSVPCGFEGYPLHNVKNTKPISMCYNTEFDFDTKPRRQYFGFSNITGIDYDIFSYKGKNLSGTTLVLSDGFHMDSIINQCTSVKVDGEARKFVGVVAPGEYSNIPRIVNDSDEMKDSLYEDILTRKFTVCFYGGFDGWDIYRKQRSNTNEFKATKYKGIAFDKASFNKEDLVFLNLPENAIPSDYYAYLGAYRQFSNPEDIDINIYTTPGIDWYNNELLVEDALDVIEDSDEGRGGDALYIVDSPNFDNPAYVVEELEDTSIDTSYAATYWPWIKYYDKDENMYVQIPVTKDVVRNLAYIDNTSYPWFAPAGVNRGNVDCVRAAYKTRLTEEDMLYDAHINPIKTFAADGVKVWGNKTLYRNEDSPLNRINVRRLMLRIKKLISNVGKQLIFDQYDTSLKNQFLGLVTPILSNVKANGGIFDYMINIDDSVEARDAHTLPCTIRVKPTPTLEYIDLTFTVYPESVDFRE